MDGMQHQMDEKSIKSRKIFTHPLVDGGLWRALLLRALETINIKLRNNGMNLKRLDTKNPK